MCSYFFFNGKLPFKLNMHLFNSEQSISSLGRTFCHPAPQPNPNDTRQHQENPLPLCKLQIRGIVDNHWCLTIHNLPFEAETVKQTKIGFSYLKIPLSLEYLPQIVQGSITVLISVGHMYRHNIVYLILFAKAIKCSSFNRYVMENTMLTQSKSAHPDKNVYF